MRTWCFSARRVQVKMPQWWASVASLWLCTVRVTYIIEAGNSFGLAGDYWAKNGLSVHRVSIKPGRALSLAPFVDSHMLVETDPHKLVTDEQDLPDLDGEERDVLGEMEIIARLMITGGEKMKKSV